MVAISPAIRRSPSIILEAPIVWAVQLFYKLMIPFMVGGLTPQIALHLWRVVVNR